MKEETYLITLDVELEQIVFLSNLLMFLSEHGKTFYLDIIEYFYPKFKDKFEKNSKAIIMSIKTEFSDTNDSNGKPTWCKLHLEVENEI